MAKKDDKEIVDRVKRRYKHMYEADQENREEAMEDLKFANEPGAQWDYNMKQERGDRPCYEFNKIRITGKRIINDIRANRPAGKIRAVENGDKQVADIYEGLNRNIWNISDADTCTDYAGEYQVFAGMGAWRVDTEYSSDTAFDQDIFIRSIENPFCLYADPGCKDPLKRDAEDWILTERIPFKLFEKQWPKAEKIDFDDLAEFDDEDWSDEQTVRVAEYWYKQPVEKELWQLDDGTVVDSTTDEANAPELQARIVRKRTVQTNDIMWVCVSGDRILEGPTKWAGSKFPFVMVYGEYLVIDGCHKWWGITRFAKDAQRSYNFARTAIAETIALAPQTKWWATQAQAAGLTNQWATAHKKNYPYILYNADPKAPGPPVRMGGADVPVALIQESQLASDEIKAVTGIFDESLGQQSTANSGRAIYARQQQGEIATFNYQDNMAKAIKYTHELLIDLIPNIYDTERELRVLGSDGAEDYVVVNQTVFDPEAGRTVRINDLGVGKYDVTVTVGPNFSTKRQEAAEIYMQLTQNMPDLWGVAGDLIFKSMDLPYADDVAERLKAMLPPQIQQMINSDQSVPPEVQQAMAQVDQAMQQVQQQAQQAAQMMSEAEQGKSEAEKEIAGIKTEMANLRAAKAEFDAHIAKTLAQVAEKEANLVMKEAGITEKAANLTRGIADMDTGAAQGEIANADSISSIDNAVSTFMQAADAALGQLNDTIQSLANRKPVSGNVSRKGGKLTADVEYSDGTKKKVSAVRDGGNLRLVEANDEPESSA